MANYMNIDNLKYNLFEVLKVNDLASIERYQEYDIDSCNILIDSTKDYSDQVMFPLFKEMDEQGAHYKDGKVIVHPIVGQFMKDMGENGSIGPTFDYDDGGMQMPYTMHTALAHIAQSANNSLPGYTGLTGGSAGLIITFGSQELKETYTPKMLSGEWGGTMCLTEPQAGSSLSDITTSGKPNGDGSYSISGQKIFISGGDHEYCDNFVHLVLVRIEGAPAGTKGISLFVVPKLRITADGGLEPNDVTTAGDYQKMGQKGYCTTHLVFGESNDCQGWLVGEENKGLKYMFQMMNGARIDVGMTAASTATAAYYASLQYAEERPQGRRILSGGAKNVNAEQTTIINHPDVRRMLLLQKSVTEGSVALLLQASLYHDLSEYGPEETREQYHDLLEILTPIAKTYPSEMGRISISNGLQILGGYGFCTDFPLEQYYRDIRIMSLYEGTTGIQSLDLLGRKIVMKDGQAMQLLTKEIIATIKAASEHDSLKPYAEQLKTSSKTLEAALMHLLGFAMSGESERYIADATIFMEMMSNVVLAWQWLKLATTAEESIRAGETKYSQAFYASKIHTMKYFYKYELPKIEGHKVTLMSSDSLTIKDEKTIAFA